MATMDWLPTLLAAAGASPDAAYPPDGEDLGPVITGRAASHPRKLYRRFKAGSQRAVREADWKYLQIAGNEFLFDVVKDPRERANPKDRQKDAFDRLKRDWRPGMALCCQNDRDQRPLPTSASSCRIATVS